MKKLFFTVALTIVGLANANLSSNSSYSAESNIEGRTVYWVSTCNIRHTTTFPDSYSSQDIAVWVSNQNLKECKERPSNVIVELSPSELRVTVVK